MVRLPSFRLHKASGQGMTTIRGKDYYFGPYDAPESRTKYNRLLAEYLSADRTPRYFDTTDTEGYQKAKEIVCTMVEV